MQILLRNWAGALVLAWILSACSATHELTAPEPAERAETPAPQTVEQEPARGPEPAPPEERVFKVDGAASMVEIRVYREGRLAHLGHNHIISSRDLRGTVTLARKINDSSLDLQLPVATLIVDDPEVRKAAGKDFATPIGEADIEGARTNMLGPKVLDAKSFPSIGVRATVAGGELPLLNLDASVQILGIDNAFRIPVKVETRGDKLTASGIFEVHQSNIGIKPFSTLVGALKVQDKLTIRFRIVAREIHNPHNARLSHPPS